jgi:hypothetical protein
MWEWEKDFYKVMNTLLHGEVEVKDINKFLTYYPHQPTRNEHGILLSPIYAGKVRAIDHNKLTPLNINELKDIENVLDYVKESFSIVGNKVVGNSTGVTESTNVLSSTFVHNSTDITLSQYVAFSSFITKSKYVFGSHDIEESSFIINTVGMGEDCKRVFESMHLHGGSSDVYFSHHISGGREIMFSFFVFGKQYVIANTQLPKHKYQSIKQHLLEQMRDDLKQGTFKHFFQLLLEVKEDDDYELLPMDQPPQPQLAQQYSRVTQTVLNQSRNLTEDQSFLTKQLPWYDLIRIRNKRGEDVTGGRKYWFKDENVEALLSPPVQAQVEESDDISVEEILQRFKTHAGINFSKSKQSTNVLYSPTSYFSSYVYKTVLSIHCKYVAYSFWPKDSALLFGASVVNNSSTSIRVFSSTDITRSFEVEGSDHCSEVYFCSGCYNVRRGMFSFGIRGKSNVVANTQLSSTEFDRVKAHLLPQVLEQGITLFDIVKTQ